MDEMVYFHFVTPIWGRSDVNQPAISNYFKIVFFVMNFCFVRDEVLHTK